MRKVKVTNPILRMKTRMNDTVHIKIKIVIFDVVRVWLTRIDGDLNALDNNRFFLDGVDNHHRIFLCKPSIERWDSHRSLSNADRRYSIQTTKNCAKRKCRRLTVNVQDFVYYGCCCILIVSRARWWCYVTILPLTNYWEWVDFVSITSVI